MNKTELSAKLAVELDCTKAIAVDVVDAFCDIITEAVASGDNVQLIGFGTFSAKSRAERQGRNPATGAAITIAACKAPHFKAGSGFKEAINKQK